MLRIIVGLLGLLSYAPPDDAPMAYFIPYLIFIILLAWGVRDEFPKT
jgi:hypothetical protein